MKYFERNEHLAANFEGRTDFAFPKVVAELSTQRVLVTHFEAGCKITDTRRVALQPRTFQINKVAEGSCHVGQLALLHSAYGLRLGVEHGLVGVDLIELAEQLVSAPDQHIGEIGVKLRAGAPPDLGDSNFDIRM